MWPQLDAELRIKSMSLINDKIRAAVEAPEPIVKLENGTHVEVLHELKFESFITDADFENYLIVKEDGPAVGQSADIYWWYIALPVIIALLLVLTGVFAFLAYRRRKVFIMKEQEILEK